MMAKLWSSHGHGFRSGLSGHQAVLKAREYAAGGGRWLVDMALEKSSDRVDHDILNARGKCGQIEESLFSGGWL